MTPPWILSLSQCLCEILRGHRNSGIPWILLLLHFKKVKNKPRSPTGCPRVQAGRREGTVARDRQAAELCGACLPLRPFTDCLSCFSHSLPPPSECYLILQVSALMCYGKGSLCRANLCHWAPLLSSIWHTAQCVLVPLSPSTRECRNTLPCSLFTEYINYSGGGLAFHVCLLEKGRERKKWPGFDQNKVNVIFRHWAWDADTKCWCPAWQRGTWIQRSVHGLHRQRCEEFGKFVYCIGSIYRGRLLINIGAFLSSWDQKSLVKF